jgi:hypothetical protein
MPKSSPLLSDAQHDRHSSSITGISEELLDRGSILALRVVHGDKLSSFSVGLATTPSQSRGGADEWSDVQP